MDLKHEAVSDTINKTMEVDKLAYVNGWFLMGSPFPVLIIVVAYLLFVMKIGPEFMKNRKPFQLKNILLCYNIIQVAISYGLLQMCITMISNHGLLPKTCVMETDAQRYMLTSATYAYFSAKVSELLDTVFFVLRKKNDQVSFLHVYHHTLMVLLTWSTLKYEPSYFLVFLGTANSFVHVLMYTYYGLSSFPSLTRYLWWKKYITTVQLIQFVAILIHFCIYNAISECTPSLIMTLCISFNTMLFLYMFGNFYVDTYIKRNKAGAKNGDSKAKLNGKGKETKAGNDANGISNRVGKKTEQYKFETAYLKDNIAVNRKYNSISNR